MKSYENMSFMETNHLFDIDIDKVLHHKSAKKK